MNLLGRLHAEACGDRKPIGAGLIINRHQPRPISANDQFDGEDIRYKMGQKAKTGGTLGRAKLGYLNVRESLEDGREVRTVAIDPDRGHLMTLAFELFATNQYTVQGLADELTERGLRTRATARYPAGPVSDSQLSRLLRDRYYLGYITYKGVEYKGRHPALVSPELFERVQEVLATRTAAQERQRKHHHYLKGSLWCRSCHQAGRDVRMIVAKANGNGGTYWYFFCRGRQEGACIEPHIDMAQVEDAVIDHYATLRFEAGFTERVQASLKETAEDQDRSVHLLQQQLTAQLAKLDTREDNLLELAEDGSLPQARSGDASPRLTSNARSSRPI